MSFQPPSKKAKLADSRFNLDFSEKEKLKQDIANSGPYKHGVIEQLFNDELLREARKEIFENITLKRKDTDIYTVNQSGDLANLKGLDKEDSSRLPALNKVADAIYSPEFREYLSYVSQSGPLSGTKQDLSINLYDRGCHLLNHDDVIDTRRISFILYLTDPDDTWQPKWGGALRLFPTIVPNIPAPDWTLSIPPKWNQLAFFFVQPGLSFHDVEEVYINKPRLSISGWFHIPQKGEEGYIEGEKEATEARSSLSQLESSKLAEHDYPKREFEDFEDWSVKDGDFSEEETKLLQKFLNPVLLQKGVMTELSKQMESESMVEIRDFLESSFADKLKKVIDEDDLTKVPKRSSDIPKPWDIARPPHKQSYMYLQAHEQQESENGEAEESAIKKDNLVSLSLLEELTAFIHSSTFRRWLYYASGKYLGTARRVFARRFRPGYDFTLATAFDPEEDHTLEACLGLTPSLGWEDGDVGGYDVCMLKEANDSAEDAAVLDTSESGDEKVIFNQIPEWNVFQVILRDAEVDRFVKYVSKSAPGSRWDVYGEWKVTDPEE